ncbi:MAG: DUF1929 domain-containing protein [Lewinellaceae bacterium]|nr:DUF1929 domain-containing protein [Lewinellaceae bacterium]
MKKFTFLLILLTCALELHCQFSVAGNVADNITAAVPGARIILFNTDTTFFAERRTDTNGDFKFTNIASGNYTLGIAKPGKEYRDTILNITEDLNGLAFTLFPETHPGKWDIIMNSPEPLGGTDLGILLPDGRIFYCHDTKDPFLFDPQENDTAAITGSDTTQGCVGPTLLYDGRVIFLGGTGQEVYGPGTRKVKTYDPASDSWQWMPSLLDYRWYPSVVPFPNGRLLVIGGGGLNNPVRVNTAEIYDPYNLATEQADNIQVGNEVSPIVLLYTGEVLMTHRPPQLFNIQSRQWNSAADFVQGNRMPNGDHSDHEIVLLPEGDGRVVAIGYISFTGNLGNLIEIYDPVNKSWSLGSNFSPMRSRAKTVLLPDKKILVAGGFKEEMADASHVNQWGQLFLTDLYDPYQDSWRRLDGLHYAREYHCTTILVPDGRVIAVGGEGQPGNEPAFSVIEAFSPPYLFRGVRPEITNLNARQFTRGGQITFDVQKADTLTNVILMSTASVTHFMNSGNNRYLELDFTQDGHQVTASIPSDSLKAPYGYYMLFAMVDDVPSIGAIVNVSSPFTTFANESIYEPAMNFAVYPNPSGDQITVKLPEKETRLLQLTIIDANGEIVQKEKINARETGATKTFSLSGFANGTYFISLESNNKISTQKFILTR